MLKISWDAGHAGFGVTPGKRALDNSMYEWDFNDGVVDYAMEALSHYENVEQLRVDDPSGRVDVPLSERANRVNQWGSHLHISVHGNAATPSANGIETFVHPSASALNRDIALHIHNYVVNRTNRGNRGLKEADFQILRATNADSLLIEGGFMTNPEELALMKTNQYRATVGRAIADAIVTKFNLKGKNQVENQPTNVIRYIDTGGYAGPALLEIHNYLVKTGHNYDTKRGPDGSILFLVGPFDTGMANYKEATASISKFDSNMRILTREQAADWR
ncbi:N-acetylmuramoyl-L-alanine amidase [Neobacillus sp. 179-C4.2 HS]|jgi:N-acetylmuramoyl-L-alanine amidase|uniref:N-acetylmuramoyl-L-alanine amidase n=1 Tax=Neobacillus driksii TaxID=3035913 RepID=A0ABV4Z014_9BACI|nr:N-acetylmuramoyl-L-alanine amidase [Neobacillus sp. 179.-C4.2 HS]MDP5196674.1 N-acetylmuramoyl-L-alanine amidase [Neobacillus sp. 179.-C4.2 HS]